MVTNSYTWFASIGTHYTVKMNALSNQKNCGNRLQTILLITFNKLELSNNESN